jgi:hypothetical protein
VYDKQRDVREYSAAYCEWINSHPEHRIFDDIVATLRFCKMQYDSRAISIAGVGCGGGWALQAACDLSDIRCAAAEGLGNVDEKTKEAAAAGAGIRALTSTMDGKPRTLKLSPNERKPVNLFLQETEFKKAADAMLSEIQGLQGLEELDKISDSPGDDNAVPASEGSNRLEEALEDAAAEDPIDGSAKKKSNNAADVYEEMERKLKELRAEAEAREVDIRKSRAQRGATLVAEYASVSLGEVALLEPCAVLALSPSLRVPSKVGDDGTLSKGKSAAAVKDELDRIAGALSVPAFLVFGESDSSPGAE